MCYKGAARPPFLLTNGETHEALRGQQGQKLTRIQIQRGQDKSDQHRAATDPRRRQTVTCYSCYLIRQQFAVLPKNWTCKTCGL